MSTAAAPHSAPMAPAKPSLLAQHHFLLRRLHSLTGVVPIGLFVIFHLFTNAQMLWPDKFQHEVEFIHNMPALLWIEIFGLWLPIAFHAGLGIAYTLTGKGNVPRYSYLDNVRYMLQRVTGIAALIFIFVHIATLRWGWNILGWYTPFYVSAVNDSGQTLVANTAGDPIGLTAMSLAAAFQGGISGGSPLGSFLIVVFYLVGALSIVYHWSNGLWTAAISWGVTISKAAQARFGVACLGLGVALTIFTISAVWASVTYQPKPAEALAYEMLARTGGEVTLAEFQAVAAERGIDLSEPIEAGH
ncbi:MAG: hypothetical protein AAGK09_14530 [Planctomycetota bacterium]